MSDTVLVIGNKSVSSWSLRPWLALVHWDIPFREERVRLRLASTPQQIARWSPSGKIPVLIQNGVTIWDSLAILETLADRYPDRGLWPADPAARAWARSVSAEMHAGFPDLRRELSMDVLHKHPGHSWGAGAAKDIARILELWREARSRFGADGPYLFGRFSIADAMYAPVVTRFDTYGVKLDRESRAYVETMLAHPGMRRWYEEARLELPPGNA